jgi:hypothetical protein
MRPQAFDTVESRKNVFVFWVLAPVHAVAQCNVLGHNLTVRYLTDAENAMCIN